MTLYLISCKNNSNCNGHSSDIDSKMSSFDESGSKS